METRYLNLSIGFLFLIQALILFIRRSPNKRSNNFLGVFFLLITFYSEAIAFHFQSVHTNNISKLSYYLPFDTLLLVIMSPCFYFYVLELLHRPVKFTHRSMLLHAMPILPCIVFSILFYFQPVGERVNWLIQDFYSGSTEMTIINTVLYLQILFYLIVSCRAVGIQKKGFICILQNGFKTK